MKKTVSVILAILMLMSTFSVASFAAIIGENPDGATIDLVESGDGVEYNRGRITENRGSVGTNFGTVEKNFGVVAFQRANNVIENHGGTIKNVFSGTIKNFGGTVETLLSGTVLLFGGSVGDNYGGTIIEYKKVTVNITGASISGLTEENGETWIEKGGKIVITPNEGFVFETAPTVSGGAQVKDNGNKSYTVSGITDEITVTASAVADNPKPNDEPKKEPTATERLLELMFMILTLVAHFLMML